MWQLKSIINKRLSDHRRYSTLVATGRSLFYYLLLHRFSSKLRRTLRISQQTGKRPHTGGKIIAIVGCDGAGKSTILKEVQRFLEWKVDVRSVYLGHGDGAAGMVPMFRRSLDRFIGTFRNKKPTPSEVAYGVNSHRIKKASIFRNLALCFYDLVISFLYLGMAKGLYRKVVKANRDRLNGTILLTDRYPQNQFFGIYDGPRIRIRDSDSRIRKLLAKKESEIYQHLETIPPDVVIKLHIPAEVALHRKPAPDIETIKRKAEITSKLKFSGARVVDIDASQPLEEVVRQVRKGVWVSL